MPALTHGGYRVTAEAIGFAVTERVTIVEAGTTTTLNFKLAIRQTAENVIVTEVVPLINYEQHQLGTDCLLQRVNG